MEQPCLLIPAIARSLQRPSSVSSVIIHALSGVGCVGAVRVSGVLVYVRESGDGHPEPVPEEAFGQACLPLAGL